MHPASGLACFLVSCAWSIAWGLTVPEGSALYYSAIPIDASVVLIQLGLSFVAKNEFSDIESQRKLMNTSLQSIVSLLLVGAAVTGFLSVFLFTPIPPMDQVIWACVPLYHLMMAVVDPCL